MITPHLSLVRAVNEKNFHTISKVRKFTLIADEPTAIEGTDLGPSPFDFLNVSLASCTAMFLRTKSKVYKIETGEILVKIKIIKTESLGIVFERTITFENEIDQAQKLVFLEEAKHTPITKIISNSHQIETKIT
jgi:uncharacterized OsmC-like protein